MLDKTMLRALIDLSPKSMTQIAKDAQVNQANLSAWFSRDRYLSEEAIERVESQLGVETGQLSTDRVYVWRTGRDFGQLQHILDHFFVEPKLMPVVKCRARRYELTELFAQPMAIVFDEQGHRALLTLKTSVTKEIFKSSDSLPWFSPDFLAGTSWLRPVQDESHYPFPEPLQIKTADFQQWKKGDISISHFNELLKASDTFSWQMIIDEATGMGIDAAEVIGWLPLIKNAESMNQDDIQKWIDSHIKQ